jgi:hypothetical protein
VREAVASGNPANGQEHALLMQIQQQAARLRGQLDLVRAENAEAMQELARRGVRPDAMQVIHMRVDMLVESVAEAIGPQGALWAVRANLAYEQRMARAIAEIKDQSVKAQLGLGGMLSPADIRALARETGTYGGV